MKKLLLFFSIVLVLTSCNRREPDQLERTIAETLKKANNNRSYDQIQPFLSNDFHFSDSDVNTSFTLLYSYLNFSYSEKISKVEIDYAKDLGDSLVELKGTKYFEKSGAEGLRILYRITKDGPKILELNSLRPHQFPLVTRASYVNEEIFGEDPVRNIVNLEVLDKSSADSISEFGYTVFYKKSLKAEGENALILFKKLDSLLINGFKKITYKEKIFFLQILIRKTQLL
ncbi:hypothetical protein GCM10010465_19990 [Actinomadura fibrosa]